MHNQNHNNSKNKLSKLKEILNCIKFKTTISKDNLKPEVILLIYQRPHKLKSILEAFSEQSFKDFKINILNNNFSKKEEINQIANNFPNLNITLEHSIENQGSKAKFIVAKKSKGNPLIFIDDDMIPHQDFVEYMIEEHKKFGEKYILGWFSFIFKKEDFDSHEWPNIYEEADYIGSGSMILDRTIIDNTKELQNIPEYAKKAEDLWLSSIARKKGYNLVRIKQKVNHFPDNQDQYLQLEKGKENYKNKLFKILRKSGWRLIKDNKTNHTIPIH